MVSHRPPWMADASCLNEDPDLWYERGEADHYADARRICATCPAIDDCLTYALAMEAGRGIAYRAGLWAGTTPRERWQLDRARREAATA